MAEKGGEGGEERRGGGGAKLGWGLGLWAGAVGSGSEGKRSFYM